MAAFVEIGGLKVNEELYRLVADEIAPGTGVHADRFWKSLGEIVRDLGPKNRALLEKRDELQKQIDQYHRREKASPSTAEEYKPFSKTSAISIPEGKVLRSLRPMLILRLHRSPAHSWWCRWITPATP